MIRINLLPFRAARRKENVRRQITMFLFFLVFLFLGLVFCNFYFSGRVQDLTQKVNSTRIALNAKKKQAAEVDRIQKELKILAKKTDVIINLALSRKEAVLLLDTMTKMVIQKRMWFTSLEEKATVLDIKGVALDNKTVADFMTRLEKAEIFNNVRLKSTKKTKIGDYDNLKSFVVSLNKIPLSEIAKAREEAKKS
jgi:type IV pilus assembly protein PilN